MLRRINIFGFIFVILALQTSVTPSDIPSSTEPASTNEIISAEQQSTSTEPLNSPITEAPNVFPSNATAGKPIIPLNATVNKPDLSDIRTKDDTVGNTTHAEGVDFPNQVIKSNNSVPINSTETSITDGKDGTDGTNVFISSTERSNQVPASKPIDTEVPDLLEIPTVTYIASDLEPVSPKIAYGPNEDVDLSIMLFDKVTRNEDSLTNANQSQEHVGLIQGQLAAVLAGVFVVVSIFGYVALLSWRRFLENRYGNREMLVNDEDFYSNDLGPFSI